MKTQYIKPCDDLADLIDCYYIRKSSQSAENNNYYPTLKQELIFNFNEDIDIRTENKLSTYRASSCFLMGIHTKPYSINTEPGHYSIGIIFKPWGLYKMFGIRSSAYTNKIIDGSALIDFRYLQFIYDFAKIYPPIEVINNIESWLLKNNKSMKLNPEFVEVFNKFEDSNTQKGAITKISEGVDLCPKSFIEKFKTIIGITPIQYLHIKQINTALKLLKEQPTLALTNLSNDLGFYDQAHFIRVFKAYCKITPGQCRKLFFNSIVRPKYEALSA